MVGNEIELNQNKRKKIESRDLKLKNYEHNNGKLKELTTKKELKTVNRKEITKVKRRF